MYFTNKKIFAIIIIEKRKEKKMIILAFIFDYLITAGLFAIACQVLHWIGIFTIGSFVVTFSWKMTTAFWILLIIFRALLPSRK